MDFALSLISIDNIMDLPVLLSGIGMLLVLLFLVRFLRSIFSLHLITAFTSLMYAFAILVVLSNFGGQIANALGLENAPPQSSQHLLDDRHQRLA